MRQGEGRRCRSVCMYGNPDISFGSKCFRYTTLVAPPPPPLHYAVVLHLEKMREPRPNDSCHQGKQRISTPSSRHPSPYPSYRVTPSPRFYSILIVPVLSRVLTPPPPSKNKYIRIPSC